MRPLKKEEIPLVSYMVQKAGLNVDVQNLRAESMNDGGMGSLHFFTETEDPKFGGAVAEYGFKDEDDIPVYVTLMIDQNGKIFELDLWKVDFSPLQKWPNPQCTA